MIMPSEWRLFIENGGRDFPQGPHNSRAKAFYAKRNDSAIILYAAADPPSPHVRSSHFDEYGPFM